ncbi:hypothetical protein NKJ23_31995 [Mesorhizobium sp. M0184]|uniref:hypothetical protein n=1 Tax=Mesorhizobium sp. M0184 TaxID=2956906 RepID=UPI00333A6683
MIEILLGAAVRLIHHIQGIEHVPNDIVLPKRIALTRKSLFTSFSMKYAFGLLLAKADGFLIYLLPDAPLRLQAGISSESLYRSNTHIKRIAVV